MGVHYSEAENRNAGVHKPRAPVVVEREFRRVAPNICESSVRNLFNATLLALRILAPFRDVLFQTALSEENHKTKISLSLSSCLSCATVTLLYYWNSECLIYCSSYLHIFRYFDEKFLWATKQYNAASSSRCDLLATSLSDKHSAFYSVGIGVLSRRKLASAWC